MNDDSCLDCSDIPCSDCGYPRGDCHCTPEQVESAHHIAQQPQPESVPRECYTCGRVRPCMLINDCQHYDHWVPA